MCFNFFVLLMQRIMFMFISIINDHIYKEPRWTHCHFIISVFTVCLQSLWDTFQCWFLLKRLNMADVYSWVFKMKGDTHRSLKLNMTIYFHEEIKQNSVSALQINPVCWNYLETIHNSERFYRYWITGSQCPKQQV